MSKPLRLGVAGLGTVGAGLLQPAQAARAAPGGARSAGRSQSPASRRARSARSRGVDIERHHLVRRSRGAGGRSPSIDVFVELIGGADGPAKAAVEAALKAGKHVVTANKALLAKHGTELAKLAEKNGVALNFEAAVAGGIPSSRRCARRWPATRSAASTASSTAPATTS